MKTFNLFFSALLFTALISSASNAQVTQQWFSQYTPGTGTNSNIIASVIDAANNVYVTGRSSNAQFDFDIVTIKYNSAGVQQWATRYHRVPAPGSSAVPTAIAIDNSGNVYVCGTTSVVSGNFDMLTIKYNSSGVEQWSALIDGGTSTNDFANSLKADNSGNVYVTGHYMSGSPALEYITTIKYNSAGSQSWLKTFRMASTNATLGGVGLTLDNSGNICITGSSTNGSDQIYIVTIKYNTAGDSLWTGLFQNSNASGSFHQIYATRITSDALGNFYVGGYSGNPTTALDFITLKYNSSGSLVWSAFNSGAGANSTIRDIKVDNSGNVFVVGITYATIGARSSWGTIKYNSAGVLLWKKIYNAVGTSFDEPYSIALDNKGNSYVTGDRAAGSPSSNITTLKYDSLGTQKWEIADPSNIFGTSGSRSVSVDTSGNVYIGGFSDNQTKYLTLKYSQTVGITNISNQIPDGFLLKQNYPNPFNPVTNIKFTIPFNSNVKLLIFNSLGQEVETLIDKEMSAGEYRVDWNASNYPSGEYFYRMEYKGNSSVKKMMLIK